MRDENQVFIYNQAELSLIQKVFSENDVLLYIIRKVLLQFPLTEVEKGLFRMQVTPEVHAVLKKRLLPDIGDEYPIGQLPSILVSLSEQLKAKNVDELEEQFASKELEIDYLEQQFAVLKDLDAPQPIKLKEMAVLKGKSLEQKFVGISAYLFLLGYIDPMLNMIKVIAGSKDETPEEKLKRLERDSTK